MYRGDDVFAIVLDIGSNTIKAGFAGDDTPQSVIPTDIGMVWSKNRNGVVGSDSMEDINSAGSKDEPSHYCFGTNALSVFRENMEIKSPMEGGLISDWNGMNKLLKHTFSEHLQVDPKEHPVLLSEPSFNTSALREKATELFFEDHGVPALFLAKSAVLSSFAHGRATSIVLESGGSTTVATPVHDGYVLSRAMVRSNLAGDELTNIFSHLIKEQANIDIQPNYMLRKQVGQNRDVSVVAKKLANVDPSFHQYQTKQVVQDIKESTCKVYENDFDIDALSAITTADTSTYTLPDNSVYNPAVNRYRIPEILFNPSKHIPTSYPSYSSLQTCMGIPKMIIQAISACDADIKKDFYQNIFFVGGNTLFPGFHERAMQELTMLVSPQIKLKNQSLPTPTERKFATFIGGSILGSLGTFHQMWMSKQEYEEYGRGIVDRKCP